MLLSAQLASLAYMSGVGCLCALTYDLIRALQSPAKNLKGPVACLRDLLYWMAAALMLCTGLLLTAHGQPRAAHLLAAVGGAALYFYLISPLLLTPLSRAAAVTYLAAYEVFRSAAYLLGAPIRAVKGAAHLVRSRLRLPGWLSMLTGGESAE